MSRERFTPEQIIGKLREAEVALAQGQTAVQGCRTLGIAEQTFYRWRHEYGGLKVEQAKRLRDLEQENARLRRAVADLTLDKLILQEAIRGKLLSPTRRRQCIEHIRKALPVSERQLGNRQRRSVTKPPSLMTRWG
jgi:putative transposase